MTRSSGTRRHGLARVLSKRGICSRSEAERLIRAGQVRLDGRVVRDPEHPTDVQAALIDVAGSAQATSPRYVMLNKPRGLVTTARDEHGRDTVYRSFEGSGLGWLAPVGRLDKASEGLLLFTNDPQWGAVLQAQHGIAIGQRLQFGDLVEVDDRRPVDANELRRIQPRREAME